MADELPGLYRKFTVERANGSSGRGGKHEHCDYFVLDWIHDKFARVAALAYADACEAEYPDLAHDLRDRAAAVVAHEMLKTMGFELGPGWKIGRGKGMIYVNPKTGYCAFPHEAETMGAIVRKAEAPAACDVCGDPEPHVLMVGECFTRTEEEKRRAFPVAPASPPEQPSGNAGQLGEGPRCACTSIDATSSSCAGKCDAHENMPVHCNAFDGEHVAGACPRAKAAKPAEASANGRNLLSELCRDLRESFRCVCDPETTDDEPCECEGDGHHTADGDGCWVCLANRYEEMATEAPAAAPAEQPSRNPLQLPAKAPAAPVGHVFIVGPEHIYHGPPPEELQARIAALEADLAKARKSRDEIAAIAVKQHAATVAGVQATKRVAELEAEVSHLKYTAATDLELMKTNAAVRERLGAELAETKAELAEAKRGTLVVAETAYGATQAAVQAEREIWLARIKRFRDDGHMHQDDLFAYLESDGDEHDAGIRNGDQKP